MKKTYIIIKISKISTMYVNMVTRPMYKKKEVSTPPNKMKHISSLQRNVFLPLTYRSLKRNHIFSTILPLFVMIDKGYKKLESFTQETKKKIIKDDQGGTRNPYKCMNVMK